MAWRSLISREYILPEQVKIFDTTLRDGEQTPGVALRVDDKVEIAKALDELGVDIIEAGFPMVSKGEAEAIKKISKENLNAKVCVLARANSLDIDKAVECEVDWVHVFIATSDIHLKHKLRISREEAIRRAVKMVEYAKDHGLIVHFSAEDATRTELNYLVQVFKSVEEAGADSIDIPDTVGFATPTAMRIIVSTVKNNLKIPVAVHCHDDMGLAVANSLTGVEAGAEIIHATINGLGERAGNASLEEIVVALHTLYGIKTGVKLEKIYGVSRIVEKLTGVIVPKNKAIVGDNAFSHESGIHVHGVIMSPETYEPIDPASVGRKRKIIIGKHSGKHSIIELARQFGVRLRDDHVEEVLEEIKSRGDMGYKISESEFLNILREVVGSSGQDRERITIKEVIVNSSLDKTLAILHLNYRGKDYVFAGFGKNNIEALINIYQEVMNKFSKCSLSDYKIWISPYSRTWSESEIILSTEKGEYTGRGVHTDPSIAFVHAFINALNQVFEEGVEDG
ncbi:MAG: 2-isopropylmalate synthase [Aigarchaeota archaeon]|nr:2-isopropylmalate synthase [Aigarchaeota archaeon]MCX8192765.1 2-isopropylmalate synthase [Nitrososphaeria archaeon]